MSKYVMHNGGSEVIAESYYEKLKLEDRGYHEVPSYQTYGYSQKSNFNTNNYPNEGAFYNETLGRCTKYI